MKLLVISILFAVCSAFATDFSVKAAKPWTIKGGVYSIEFDGSRTYPALRILPERLKPNTYYKLSFKVELNNFPLMICFKGKDGMSAPVRHQNGGRNTAGWQTFSFYFRTGKESSMIFLIYPNPGVAGRAQVRDISLDETADFGKNLLSEGDFESGNALLPRHEKFKDQLAVVDSPAFFCGERSLRLDKKAEDFAAAITRDVPAVPGRTAVIRFWAKSEHGTVPGTMYLDFYRPGHKRHLVRRFDFKALPEWKEFTFSYTIPADMNVWTALEEGMARLQFHLLKSATEATVYLDQLEYRLE